MKDKTKNQALRNVVHNLFTNKYSLLEY